MDKLPKIVFVVPYRNREKHQKFFDRHMRTIILETMNPEDYRILYIHQCDTRSFNRGAMKNIGFLFVKATWPQHYKQITLIFNDVDTLPFEPILNYETTPNSVKHFYGHKFALGGIVSINAEDFEKINGFPCFFSYGYEDNTLLHRTIKAGMNIDRSQFYPLMDENIIQFVDGIEKQVNKRDFDVFVGGVNEGVQSIRDLTYEYEPQTGFVNVKTFSTGREEEKHLTKNFDILKGSTPYKIEPPKKGRGFGSMKLFFR
jgi:predicted glycosyltransferase involved in capsule biosynthesis